MATGYEDIDRLVNKQGQMLDESLQKQNDIVNQQTQMQVDSLARQKEQIDREATQQNRALYQDYRKASNPFGQQAENLAGQGLANSGYAETTQSRLYNTYQNNITSTLNNARQLKADVDFQIQQARQSGNITLAQNALQIFNQRMQLLSQEYDLRNNREQFLYQKSQDALAQRNWQKEYDYKKAQDKKNFDYQKSIDTRNFKYQQSRDKVADTQWQKEYELSKKARASSSRSYSGSTGKKKKQDNDEPSINQDDNVTALENNIKGLLEGVAKNGLTLGSIVANFSRGNIPGALKTIRNKAGDAVYNAQKSGKITEDEAKAIIKKYFL